MFTVYVLKSASTGHFYIGQTANLERRLQEHNEGLAQYTRGRGPWQAVLTEQYETRADAMNRERALKSGRGREWLKTRVSGTLESLG